jgi:excisionase family DNA binding protein
MVDSGDLLTVAEASVQLNRSAEQVRRYLREGRLAGNRIGGQWFIDHRALQAFSAGLKAETRFLDRIPLALDANPLGKIIGIAAGGGSNLSQGKDAYRRAFRWRQ